MNIQFVYLVPVIGGKEDKEPVPTDLYACWRFSLSAFSAHGEQRGATFHLFVYFAKRILRPCICGKPDIYSSIGKT
jgi:hypothetical protein